MWLSNPTPPIKFGSKSSTFKKIMFLVTLFLLPKNSPGIPTIPPQLCLPSILFFCHITWYGTIYPSLPSSYRNHQVKSTWYVSRTSTIFGRNVFLHDVFVYLVVCTALIVKGGVAGCVLPNLQRNICAHLTLHECPFTNNICPCNFMTHPHSLLWYFYQNRHRHIDSHIWIPPFVDILTPDLLLDLIHLFLHGAILHGANLLAELPPEILPPAVVGNTLWKIPIGVSISKNPDLSFRILLIRNSTLKILFVF